MKNGEKRPPRSLPSKKGENATAEEIVAFCRKRLAGFKIPRVVESWPSLPKGGTGKILKAQLKERFWQGRQKRV